MKKEMFSIVLALMTAGLVFVANGGGDVTIPPDPNVNPLTVARAFALKTPDHYRGYLSCQMLVAGSFRQMEMKFDMAKDFTITSLVVDDDQITLSEPIRGLPLGDGGLMRNVSLNVNAMDRNGEYAGHGYVQKEVISKGDNLTVALVPVDQKQEIPADVQKYGDDFDLNLENCLYGWGWGVENGKLYGYVPTTGGRYHYTLRQRSTGLVIGEGWLEAFKPVETSKDAYVGATYLGNVQEVEFTAQVGLDDWANVKNVSFNCLIPTDDGGSVMGKVLFTDVGSGGLQVVLDGEHQVYVQSATSDNGDMPYLTLEDQSVSGPGWYQTQVNTVSRNVGKVVVTIIPKPTNQVENPWGSFHRYYGSVWRN